MGLSRLTGEPLVDVELIALGALHPHSVSIEAVLAHGSADRGLDVDVEVRRVPSSFGIKGFNCSGQVDVTADLVDISIRLTGAIAKVRRVRV
jgi:hypothetical protein